MPRKLTATAMALALLIPGLAVAQNSDSDDDKAGTTGLMTTTPTDASEDAIGTRGPTVSETERQTIVSDPMEQAWSSDPEGRGIVGQTLYGANGEEIGEIEDVVGRQDAQTAEARVSVGGFLGIGEREVAIPMYRIDRQGDQLVTDMTREELEAMQPYDEAGYQPWERGRRLGGMAGQ